MIQVENVTVDIGKTRLLSQVSAYVNTAEWLCVIGPNGAGKTTFLRALAGLVQYEGTIAIDSEKSLTGKKRANILSYCPQDPLMPQHMTSLQYVMLARVARLSLWATASQLDRDIAMQALEQVGMASFSHRMLSTLSGGERRRVSIAQALAQKTPILILDEPVTSLDIGHQQELLELLAGLQRSQGLTLVTTSHDLTLAGQYATQMMLLAEGNVVASGTPSEVLTSELISQYYKANIEVRLSGDAQISVTPIRKTTPSS